MGGGKMEGRGRFWRSGPVFEDPPMGIRTQKPYKFIGFGAMDVTKARKFIGFGAMDVTKPHEFIRFGAMDVTKPYEFIRFGPRLRCKNGARLSESAPVRPILPQAKRGVRTRLHFRPMRN